jgi:HNH endonuclease
MTDTHKDTVLRLYTTLKMPIRAVAKEMGVAPSTLRRWMKKWDIRPRSKTDAQNLAYQLGRRQPLRGKKHGRWKGGVYHHTAGYVMVICHGHPRANRHGYVMEHILVAEQMLGRAPLPNEEVHHINGIKDDNRPENLQVMMKWEHASLHGGRRHDSTADAETAYWAEQEQIEEFQRENGESP